MNTHVYIIRPTADQSLTYTLPLQCTCHLVVYHFLHVPIHRHREFVDYVPDPEPISWHRPCFSVLQNCSVLLSFTSLQKCYISHHPIGRHNSGLGLKVRLSPFFEDHQHLTLSPGKAKKPASPTVTNSRKAEIPACRSLIYSRKAEISAWKY